MGLDRTPAAGWPGRPEVPPGPWRPPAPVLPTWVEPDPTRQDRDLDERLLAQRVVVLNGHLDSALANRVTARLLLLGRRDSQPIELHLACGGSELEASLALTDAVDLLASPVHAVVRGTLRGPAVAVLCAARSRAAHRQAMFVLCLPRASAAGTAEQLPLLADQREHQVAQLRDRIARTTGRSAEEIAADLMSGRLLSAAQAAEYGLLDEVL